MTDNHTTHNKTAMDKAMANLIRTGTLTLPFGTNDCTINNTIFEDVCINTRTECYFVNRDTTCVCRGMRYPRKS